jgi:hypothetical protein
MLTTSEYQSFSIPGEPEYDYYKDADFGII